MNLLFYRIKQNIINHEKLTLLFLFGIAIVLRTIHVVIIYGSIGTSDWADDWQYLSMGSQIADGNWNPKGVLLPYMQVAPALPVLIAFFIKIFGEPTIPIFVYNIIISSLIVPVLFYLGRCLFNKKIGWLLAIWAVINIEFYKYNPHLLKESTVYFFLPLTLFFLVKSISVNNYLPSLLFSVISFTWLIHTDERYFIYAPLFALIFLFKRSLKLNKIVKLICLWGGLVLLLMIPWGIRNYRVFNQVVILSPRTTSITSKIWGEDLAKMHFTVEYKPEEKSLEKALDFGNKYGIIPREYGKFKARARAFINFWQPAYFKPTFIQYGYRPQKWSLAHNFAGLLFYGIFLPFYLIGIVLLLKRKLYIALYLASVPVIHSLLHAYMVWPLERYRSSVSFIIVMIGIFVLFELFGKIKNFYFDL